MNVTDMISQIRFRLGNRTDLQAEIMREINLAQYELERDVTFNPYFLWRAKDLCICTECLDYAVPSGFIRLCEFNNPLYQAENEFCAYELDKGLGSFTYPQNTAVGRPSYFSLQSNNIRLNTRACGVMRLFYITATTPLSDSAVENLWTEKAYGLLMAKAGLTVASAVRDNDAVGYFAAAYQQTLAAFKKECVAYEDFGYNLARADTLFHGRLMHVGGWYEPGSVLCEGCE